MSTRSPKERLQKLFHRSEPQHSTTRDDTVSSPKSPPPVSPSSAGARKHVRNSSSRGSLRDMLHNRGRSASKASRRESSGDYGSVVTPETQPAAQIAAASAMYPERTTSIQPERTTSRLPDVAHQSDLSTDLRHLTLADAIGNKPYSEAVADRNIEKRKAINGVPTNVKPLIARYDRHPEDVARSSMGSRGESVGSPITPITSQGSHNLAHKHDYNNLRNSSDVAPSTSPSGAFRNSRRSVEAGRGHIPRSSMDKPLPPQPSDEFAADLENDRVVSKEPGAGTLLGALGAHTGELADKSVDLSGIVDLSNTADTTLHEKWAPAVTHETVTRDIHTVREERITREIHNHHVFHRVLPIVDIEVLPARHFVPVDGGYAEISEDEVPGRAGPNAQWVIAETVSRMLPKSKGSVVPSRFTARKFEGTDGDYKEYISSDGIPRTEQWWVHPPTFYEPNAIASGQTYPFYIGSSNPADDGLRAGLPQGEVIGVSPLLAQQRREQMEAQQSMGGKRFEEAPPVPQHKMFPADLVDRRTGQFANYNKSGR